MHDHQQLVKIVAVLDDETLSDQQQLNRIRQIMDDWDPLQYLHEAEYDEYDEQE